MAVLAYVAIISLKLQRMERDLNELAELVRRRRERERERAAEREEATVG